MTPRGTIQSSRAPRLGIVAPSILTISTCLALAGLLYLGLTRVEWSFGKVMLFLTERAGPVHPQPPEPDGLPGKTDRLPFKPRQ